MTGSRDTIFALASAQGRAGVSVIRVSGPGAWDSVKSFCGSVPEPRKTSLRELRLENGKVLDKGIVICFEEDHSFTGELTVEYQVHGSIAIVSKLLQCLVQIPNFRHAEAGEFTRRALENGRLDLTAVEGLSDLIEAETEAQRLQAQRVFSGDLRKRVEKWRASIVHAYGLVEATIDFADEDVPVDVMLEVTSILGSLVDELTEELAGYKVSERVRSGFEVAIIGPPNVGKSTLLNFLAKRPAALTSDIPGTTRDAIEVRMDISGLAVTLVDTAGIRETDDQIENLGVQLSKDRAQDADIRIFLGCEDNLLISVGVREGDIVVGAKADLKESPGISISGKTGEGVDALLRQLELELTGRVSGAAMITHLRHKDAVDVGLGYLKKANDQLQLAEEAPELFAEHLRRAVLALDVLIGRVDVEDVLGDIFSNFCIGK